MARRSILGIFRVLNMLLRGFTQHKYFTNSGVFESIPGQVHFQGFLGTCICINWDRSTYPPRPQGDLNVLVYFSSSRFCQIIRSSPCKTPRLKYFVILLITLCFATAYSKNSRWKMFVYHICNTIGDKAIVIFTF